jgi:putative endonuclease
MSKSYYVYIITNKKDGTLYIGVTNDLLRRIYEHKEGEIEGFSRKYKLKKLVYYEETNDIISAISREKELKKWQRKWKVKLIEDFNPEWDDLYEKLLP